VFNLADSAIVCGGVIAVLLAVMGLRMDGTREGREPAEGLPENGPSQGTQTAQTAQSTKTTQTTKTTQSTEGRDDGGSALSAGP
jgi:signal peptidase II